MVPLVKRILVNGLITAAILGGLGFLFADLSTLWMAANTPNRVSTADAGPVAAEAVSNSLRMRLPFAMAIWGFGFILVAELVLYAIRGNPAPAAAKIPVDPKPDPGEQLLEQLLAEADAAQAKQGSGLEVQDAGAIPSLGDSTPPTQESGPTTGR